VSSTQRPGERGVGVHYDGDLRRALVDAAADLLCDVGADRLSLRDVARRIGVSHAAPAHHFGDRTGLLTAVAAEGLDLFTAYLRQALAATPHDGGASIADLGRAYLTFADLHPGHFDVMFRPALIRVDDPAYIAAGDAAFELLRDHVVACQAAGWHSQDDTRQLALATWALAHGLALLRRQGSLFRQSTGASIDDLIAAAQTLLSSPSTAR
jgi:AcrR family transcriptional regulator